MKRLAMGFSLIEVLLTLSIIAISALLATPSFTDQIKKARARGAVEQMMILLAFARSEAVSTGHTVTFCPSADGIECGHGATNWLLIFFDRNNNQQAEPSEMLRRETPYISDINYLLKVSAHRTYLRFRPEGTAIESGSLTLCPKNDHSIATQLIINFGGRVRVAQDSDHDRVPEDSEGNPVDCSSLTS